MLTKTAIAMITTNAGFVFTFLISSPFQNLVINRDFPRDGYLLDFVSFVGEDDFVVTRTPGSLIAQAVRAAGNRSSVGVFYLDIRFSLIRSRPDSYFAFCLKI